MQSFGVTKLNNTADDIVKSEIYVMVITLAYKISFQMIKKKRQYKNTGNLNNAKPGETGVMKQT